MSIKKWKTCLNSAICKLMLKIPKIHFITLITALIFVVEACTSDNKLPVDVFRYNESKGVSTLDPAFARSQTVIWPVSQLYNGLVELNEDNQIVPSIAKSWSISADARTYTFNLRTDVSFHPHQIFNSKTRRVKSSDFIFSFKRLTDSQTASPGAWVMQYVDADTLDSGFWAPNDSTLIIQLKKPFPGFLGVLTMPYCVVLAPEVVRYYGQDYRSHPIGTGPFYLKNWREGEKLVLRRNPNYFETDDKGNHLPYIEGIAIRFITDKQSEFLEFRKGRLDFISGVHQSYKDELLTHDGELRERYRALITMQKAPYLNTEYLGFLVDSNLSHVSEKYIRKAINFGFDRKKMLAFLRNNIGRPAINGFVPFGLASFDTTLIGYQYSTDSALYYLKKAGFANGKGLNPIVLTTTSDYVDLCEFIQHELSEIGIKIEIEISSGATFRDQVSTSKLEFFRGSWIADYPDAENYLSLFYTPNRSPKGPNNTHFSNAKFDNLYLQSLHETNDSLRWNLYRQMDRIILDEAPVVPLFYDEIVRFFQPNVSDFKTNALNMLFLKKVKKE